MTARLIQRTPVSQCPACGSIERSTVVERVQDWFFGSETGEWRFARCAICQSLFLDPRPADDALAELYENYYTHSNMSSHAGVNASRGAFLKNMISNTLLNSRFGARLTPAIPVGLPYRWADVLTTDRLKGRFRNFPKLRVGASVLDVGCGSGRYLRTVNAAGWQGFGVDFDPDAISCAKKAGLMVVEGDISMAKSFGRTFDVVSFNHVIEHLPDMVGALTAARNMLAADGCIHIEFPNPLAPGFETYGRFWRGLEAPRHLCLPSRTGITRLLLSAGLGRWEFIDCFLDRDAASVNQASHKVAVGNGAEITNVAAHTKNLEPTFLRVLAWR